MIDGVDHINAYSRGKTRLGQFLSNFWECDIETQHGTFRSVENLWQWLKYRDDALRNCLPVTAKTLPKKRGMKPVVKHLMSQAVYRQLIVKAIAQKLSKNPDMAKLFVDNKLPIMHYYEGCTVNDARFVELLEEAKELYHASVDNTY